MTAATKEEEAWQDGYEAALGSVAGLLEAARAYRDAQAAIVEFVDDHPGEAGKEWAKLFNAVDRATARLQIAARTFEGHVEEGAPATSEEGADNGD